tara:strand:- start:4545 stop:4838 length:294 start_codon:yes stop_codon:yes gene_type:complete
MIEKIRHRIQENMECSHLEILDESPNHGGYNGSVSHIKIIIVSDEFIDQSLINRHKLVYKSMGDFVEQIHAISIVSKTSTQWNDSKKILDSPECAKK